MKSGARDVATERSRRSRGAKARPARGRPASRGRPSALLVIGALGLGGLLLAAGIVWTNLVQRTSEPTRLVVPAASAAPADAAGREGERTAPDFSARLLDGGSFTLSQERGRPVLILFTASWCAPCIPEVNKMAQLHDEFGGRGLRQLVLSIDTGDTPGDFDGLRRRTRGQALQWGLDIDQRALRAYQIRATDTKVLVDAQGRIAFTSVGPTDYETLRREVARALP